VDPLDDLKRAIFAQDKNSHLTHGENMPEAQRMN
jgi:hypothetical protein